MARSQERPAPSNPECLAAEGGGKCRAGGRDNGSFIYVFKLRLLPQTMERWWVLVPPLGAHIQSALQGQMPRSHTARLHVNLKACVVVVVIVVSLCFFPPCA